MFSLNDFFSAVTSNALKATSPTSIKGFSGPKAVALRNPREEEEHSDVPSSSNGSATLLSETSDEFYIICLKKKLHIPKNDTVLCLLCFASYSIRVT